MLPYLFTTETYYTSLIELFFTKIIIGFLLLNIFEKNPKYAFNFTCSKLTTEALEQGVKYVQS